jgi:hypothetical protein
MFRQFKEKNKKHLRLKLKSALKMIQFYIPWEGEGGYDENLK